MADVATVAVLAGPAAGHLYVLALDTLVSAVHFPHEAPAADVAWKSLAVNLSDLAAMGADPLALQAHCEAPGNDTGWLRDLREGLALAAQAFATPVHVVSTTGAVRRISVQVLGHVPRDGALTRAGARAGDDLWVSGTLGDAGAGLALVQGRLQAAPGAAREHLLARLARPEPRLALGRALRGVASAAIDVSDGIVGDAGHLARRSGVALRIRAHALPISDALRATADAGAALDFALRAGDDYELLFCSAPADAPAVRAVAAAAGTRVSCIGAAVPGHGVSVRDERGNEVPAGGAYQHFCGHGRGAGR
jgi:thiamine-monophosphate kinase